MRGRGLGVRGVVAGAVLGLASVGLALPAGTSARPVVRGVTTVAASVAAAGWSRALHTALPTEMVGFDWAGRVPASLEVRSLDHGYWSPWKPVRGAPGDDGPDAASREHRDRTAAGPVWVGGGVRRMEARLVTGDVRDLRLVAIRSERAPAHAGVAAAAEAPGIISRAGWGADENWRNCPPDYADTVRYAVVHHTDDENNYSASDSPALVRGMYWFHTHTRGWCDLGYNFVVDRFGQVFEGRAGGITRAVIGAHAGGFNTESTGVALLGNFETTSVGGPMYAALERLLAWKFSVHGVLAMNPITVTAAAFDGSKYAAGARVTIPRIVGHRDLDATDCPGGAGYGILDRLRGDVARDVDVHNPVGAFETAGASLATARVTGWAADADVGAQPIPVDVAVDGRVVARSLAARPRPDVAAAHPDLGAAHGFDVTVWKGVGAHTVCLVARNAGPGKDAPLGCRRV